MAKLFTLIFVAAAATYAIAQEQCSCAPQPTIIQLSCGGNRFPNVQPSIPPQYEPAPQPQEAPAPAPAFQEYPIAVTEAYPETTTNVSAITVYDTLHFRGRQETFTFGHQCVNFPYDWDHTISAIDSRDFCVYLYNGVDCTGGSILVKPGTCCHYDLAKLNFDNKARSFRSCY